MAVVDLVQDGEFQITSPQDLRSRLQLLGDALSAPDASKNISEDAQTLLAAADGARCRRPWRACLRRLLDVGNALNAGTRRGDAKGFTLASLERVAATKSTDASAVSVLDFAARKALTGDGENDLEKLEPLLRAARKLELRELEKESGRLARCSAKISESGARPTPSATGWRSRRPRPRLRKMRRRPCSSAPSSSARNRSTAATYSGPCMTCGAGFQAARLKVRADEERKARAHLEESAMATPEAKRERRREEARRARPSDDVLEGFVAGTRCLCGFGLRVYRPTPVDASFDPLRMELRARTAGSGSG